MLNRRASRGFTLMELIIGVGIALLVLTGLVMAFTASTKTTTDTLKRVRQTQDLRGAMAMMVRDVRRAGYWAGAAAASGAGAAWSNPFGAIDDATAGCLSFRYDRDADGTAGAAENFGFRLNGGAVEAMTAGDASNCAAGGNTWEALTDPKVNTVTALAFAVSEETASAGAGSIVVRSVEIRLEGNVAGNAASKQQLVETVRIRNDLYRPVALASGAAIRAAGSAGAAALGVTLVLLFLLTILGVLGSRVLVQETRTSANELQAARAFEAAEAGLEYGVAWLNANAGPHAYVADNAAFGGAAACAAASACQRIATDQSLSVGGFNVAVRFRRATVPLAAMNHLEVIAHAVSAADASNKATSRQTVFVSPFNRNQTGSGAPPLVINGCLSGVTGNPDLYPAKAGATGIVSSQPAACLDEGHMNLHGGAEVGNGFTGTAWDYVFPGMPKADMKAVAAAQAAAGIPLAERSVIWVEATGPWHDSVGSLGPPVKPVVLVFAAASGCPKINGNPTIVGIVYFEAGCDSNGFGGATVEGSVVYEGALTKFNANTVLRYNAGVNTVVTTGGNLGGKIPKVAGTWRDF